MKYKEIINKKNSKKVLTYDEIKYMINSYVSNDIDDEIMTLFIKSIYEKGLNYNETLYLTDIMLKSGEKIDLSSVEGITVDKHSTGGVGDKTSLIILPICASLGLKVSKMSGKSLGITGGTVDKLDSIPGYKSNLSHTKFIDILNKVGCADICQSKKIAVADKKVYALRDKTGYVDSIPLIASSIMSKKLACSSKNIVIDLKVGNGAFMKNIRSAEKLAKLMIKIGKYYNRKVVCILTDMSTPLGNNVGNALEVKEAINFFNGKSEKRLKELVITLSTYMLSISKNISIKKSKKLVKNVITNGEAKNKFYEWIKSQGGNLSNLKINANRIDVRSIKKGYIKNINAESIGSLCSELYKTKGKLDYNTGIVLRKNIGDEVQVDDVICSIYYNHEVNGMINKVINSFNIVSYKVKEKGIVIKVIK